MKETLQYTIENYQHIRPFSSFLPGIAGLMGIPLWVFYVNRGQAIASFGIENKDHPILEFQPANRAYQLTSLLGFRTFLRIFRGDHWEFYEPFAASSISQKLIIGANELCLQEMSPQTHLMTEVVYFLLPGENFGALVRRVCITNRSDQPISMEMLDGLPAVIPFGVNNTLLKELGRTVEAWMEVFNLDHSIPFYRLRASVADTAEVSSFEAGHFMLAFNESSNGGQILPAIVDPTLVFGQNTTLSIPERFWETGADALLFQKQITCGKTPCGFCVSQAVLNPGEILGVYTLFGHVNRLENIQSQVGRITAPGYLDEKRRQVNELVIGLTDAVDCKTSSSTFDDYCRQTYLDNLLRGGWPIILGQGENRKVTHVFSRKHGDLERDYNAFSVPPEFYSQGSGNYRDVNQNRRQDVWFNPKVGDFNIRLFMSLLQLDGYNPLVVQGSRFTLPPEKLEALLTLAAEPEKLRLFLSRSFTPGSLLEYISNESIQLRVDPARFLEEVIEVSEQRFEATTGEGYWVDHWTYNLDLIEDYLAIFPDCRHDLLFTNHDLPFFDAELLVQPRSRKYVLADGQPRQLNSLVEDPRKKALLAGRKEASCWMRVEHGNGRIYRTSLLGKLVSLVIIKFATLDPCGMGIEMEAGRPGWDDALNGLPALFGSSMAETYALKRSVRFLSVMLADEGSGNFRLPKELALLLARLLKAHRRFQSADPALREHAYWDEVTSAREKYRKSIRLGLDGSEVELSFADFRKTLDTFERKLDAGISLALELNHGLPPTYFSYSVDEYEIMKDKQDRQITDKHGRPFIRVKRFKPRLLPLFLEGMVRAMRLADLSSAGTLYDQVRSSQLFDRKLRMYKLNAPLEGLPKDIGRVIAFPPGWLENESIWLHMEYKYLLEVLRAGLYNQFFEDLKSCLIPFLDPKVYGRSPLENSSFLVSSAHPDETLHGAGFVARLSGASAEFLSMWTHMLAGARPFFQHNGQLLLALKPVLPAWLFNEENLMSFQFLGHTRITYHNPHRFNTYEPDAVITRIELTSRQGQATRFDQEVIPAPYAQMVRDGIYRQIDLHFA